MDTRREIEIEATPEEVWEALATEEGRDAWLEDAPAREILVETAEEPHRLVWWWWSGDEPATRVEVLIVAAPAGARVVVEETQPNATPMLRAVGTVAPRARAATGQPMLTAA